MTLANWATCLLTFSLAVISPGPDFLLVLRTSLKFGSSQGIATAAGIAGGTSLWSIGTLAGVLSLLTTRPQLTFYFHFLGAFFLMLYGIKILFSVIKTRLSSPQQSDSEKKYLVLPQNFLSSFSFGLATTTIGNPKAIIFYTLVFVSILPPHLFITESIILVLSMIVISFTWFVLISLVARKKTLVIFYQKYGWLIDSLLGTVFILLGLSLLFQVIM
ncbi:LysE family translocator [Actinomycetaceae bacterium TAE3-ERU4]|nr:LysE family translocator [Actinomycetaceae bacterium TAE3-ERU4]